jgi:hypothetical protein
MAVALLDIRWHSCESTPPAQFWVTNHMQETQKPLEFMKTDSMSLDALTATKSSYKLDAMFNAEQKLLY